MSDPNVRQVRVRWAGEGLVFEGGPDGGPSITLDSDVKKGPSPTHLLLVALAGCMAVDVKMILEKSRVPLESIEVEAVGVRAESAPRRFLSITLTYELRGPQEEHEARLQRALDLSREKYCSVLHSLDPGIEIELRVVRV
jgi:putative redox protein